MGRKPSRTRQHLCVCLALLALGSGCTIFEKPSPKPPPAVEPENIVVPPAPAPVPPPKPEVIVEPPEVRERREAQESLQVAQRWMARGDYEGTPRERQAVRKKAGTQATGEDAHSR